MSEKYEKKLSKSLKKLKEIENANDTNSDSKTMKIQKKIDKYKKKLIKTNRKRSNSMESVATIGSVESIEINKKRKHDEIEAKSAINTTGMTLLLFYTYVEPPWSHAEHNNVIKITEEKLASLNITGRLRVSREGFNGTLTGDYHGMRAFTQYLREWKPAIFGHMNNVDDFKLTDNLPIGQKFPKLKVFAVQELVNYGIGVDGAPSVNNGGVHLDPEDYHAKLHEKNTVVIDVRNSYEADIGRFAPVDGAEYIDPKMRVSTEFPGWLKNNIDELKKKQVLMYCTGGIRCERASALVRAMGHQNVYQLKGGIHNYITEYADKGGGCWIGDNYTFDKRFKHGTTGDFEVLGENEDKPIVKPKLGPAADVVGNCVACKAEWNKFKGKKRCRICGVPLLLCPACLDKKAERYAKCFLCQEDEKNNRKPFDKKAHMMSISGGECGDEVVEIEEWRKPLQGGINGSKKPKVNKCGVCEEVFKSRNALFKHITESGHATRKAKKQKL